MADGLESLSNDELFAMAGISPSGGDSSGGSVRFEIPPEDGSSTLNNTVAAPDFGSLSNEELFKIAGAEAPKTWKDNALSAMSGYLGGVGSLIDFADQINPAQPKLWGMNPAANAPGSFSWKDLFSSGVDKATGVEGSTEIGKGSLPYTAASYVPGFVLGPENVAKNAIQTLFSSGGATIGKKYGGTKGEVAGSLLGLFAPDAAKKTASGIASLFGPQSRQSALTKVGESLGKYASLDDVISANARNPNTMRTSAEVLQSPELAVLQQKMSGGDMAMEAASALQARKDAANSLIENVISPATNVPKEMTGQALQEAWTTLSAEEKAAASALYRQIPEGVKPDTKVLKDIIETASGKYFGPGSPSIPGSIKGRIGYLSQGGETITETSPLVDEFGRTITKTIQAESPVTIEGLQNARSHLGDIANEAFRAGRNQEGALAKTIGDSIKATIANAPEGSQEWQAANQAYKEFATKFKAKPLEKIADVLPSTVFNKIMQSPEAAKQAKKVFEKDPEGALTAIKDQIASEFTDMTDAARVRFFDKHESQLTSLLEPEELTALRSIRDDIKSRVSTEALARATGGSNTALKLSSVVEKALTGKSPEPGVWSKLMAGSGLAGLTYANPLVGIGATLAGLGTQALKSKSSTLVRQALYDSLMNPQTLEEALTAASKKPAASSVAKELFSQAGFAATNASSGLQKSESKQSPAKSVLAPSPKPTPAKELYKGKTETLDPNMDPKRYKALTEDLQAKTESGIKKIEAIIDEDPFDAAVYEMESSRNPKAKNPDSSAAGGFQIIRKTAQKLGVKDVYDLKDNYGGFLELKKEIKDRFQTDDPAILYAGHYLGSTVLAKYLKGDDLTPQQSAQVKYFENTVLPKFMKIYSKITSKTVEA